MPTFDGGVSVNVGSYTLRLTANESGANSGANTSNVSWDLRIIRNSGTAYNLNSSGISWAVYIAGGLVSSGSRSYDFRNTSEIVLAGTTNGPYGHASNGTGSVGISASISGPGPITGGSASGTVPFTDFNRSANTPYYNNITRNSATNIYVTYARTGSVNGPTTYILERATNAAMTENYTTFGEGNQTVNANTAYYYRMYAYGDEGGNKYSGVYGPYWGQPVPPTNVTGTRSTSVAGRIDVTWTKPSNTQGGIQYYHVYRNGTFLAQVNGENSVSYTDTGLSRGTNHTYQVYALGASFWSEVSNTSASTMAPGVPSSPGTPTVASKIGRTLTLNSTRGSTDYGNAISEYRIQLSTDNGVTWKGWNNTSKSFTANNTYNVLDGSGNFTYSLLTPALTYKWRVYAVNSIGTGDYATTATGTFVSSGGKRWDGSQWLPTEIAKRWDGSAWQDLTIAKRWDGSQWVDLT